MESLNLSLDQSSFNLIWRSLHAREKELLSIVENFGDDSDEGADALNDIVALRLYIDELKEQAEKVFSDKNAFILEDIQLEVGTMHVVKN
ncbi:hypothetical protein [Agaribacterium haliotis]|uniref:hypothetical protein n=1 Tax=Agaribacterium haliotis TaxID=2013869 RepID=UPI000BB56992|nr:hypothetical protein [Agaribacterium haliotis]